MKPDYGFNDLMIVAAVRYCLGRRTYIVGACAEWMLRNWSKWPENVRQVLQRDIEEEFVRDDDARKHNERYKPLGDDCDRADWEKVRTLWNKS